MTATLSRCYVAVYPVQMFADLIKQKGDNVIFSRHPTHIDSYCSHQIGLNAASFRIRVSRNVLEELGCHLGGKLEPSVLRGSITHVRSGCDVVWDSAPDWVSFLSHLRSIRSQVSELSSLHAMLL
ncbi:hypothetical protein CT0861_09537 [Colletotrichum tofieldiae]|uniref:Uncharacterized protein n=1 Tax=Colletotrichum tofieldiae TaxID=708197 RepID=A0A166MTG5_9PEZI|nr:hypothetical protein CT0861_09537 [Colletotrichum tofieldiae]